MERRPPPTSRARIPGGYGNYPGRDPESPPPQQQEDSSDGGGWGRKKRAQAPWGGLFDGKMDVTLPTAQWSAGVPLDERYDEPPPAQGQHPSGARGRGYGSSSPPLRSSPPPPRRRASPLVANAPRLTVIPASVRPDGVQGETGDTQPRYKQQRGAVDSQRSQRSVPASSSTPLSSSSSSPSKGPGGGGLSGWRSWGRANRDNTSVESSRDMNTNAATERTSSTSAASSPAAVAGGGVGSRSNSSRVPSGSWHRGLLSSSARTGGRVGAGAGGGSARSGVFSRGQSSRIGSGEGVTAARKPSPLLAVRSSASRSSSSKKGSTWISPLEQSAVNPFSASFDGSGDGGDNRKTPSWLAGSGRGGGGAGATGPRQGVGTGAGQPLLRRAGAGGGYGSGWRGDGGGGGGGDCGGGWRDASASSGKPKPSGKGREVDDQGRQIFYKHGVRLVEAAEIQLESQGGAATYAVFILPYLLLALAMWLDMGPMDVTSRFYLGGNACDDSGACTWPVTGAPVHNSFLVLKGGFQLVDGLGSSATTPNATTPDSSGLGDDSGGAGVEEAAAGGQGGGVGHRNRRILSGGLGGDVSGVGGSRGDAGGDLSEEQEDEEEHGELLVMPSETGRRALLVPFGRVEEGKGTGYDDRVRLVLGVALEIRGLVEETKEWEPLYSCGARDNVQILTCRNSDKSCKPSTLGRVVFDSVGILGYHSEYVVDARLKVIQDGEPVSGAGGLLAHSATFEVVTESLLYARVRAIARLPLLALTGFLLLYWMTRGFGGAGGERDPAPSAIVPERRYITLLLFALLLWQDPVLAVEDWLVGSSFEEGVWRWVRLGRDLCQFAGMQVMWLCWICLMDGQHFVRKRAQRADSAALEAAYRQVAGEDDASVATAGDGSTASPHFLKDDYPPHHPKSQSFIDFILPKVLYGFFSLVVGVAVALLRHPYLARLDHVDWLKGRLELSYAVLSFTSGMIWLGWAIYFAKVAVSSGRVLKGQPFFGTRRQQLSYRVMLVQGFLVAVLLGVAVGVDTFYIAGHLLRQQAVPGASTGFAFESMTSGAAGLSAWTGGIRQPLGKMILVSYICYNLAYLFLPPTHSIKRLYDRMYINMERDMPPREVVRRYKDSQELSPLFCVETSCFLVEVAWQAYYDPHKVVLSDFVAPGRQDLSYLGLELVAYFNDEEHETRAILCRGEDRLILAFRGTATVENLSTDFKFHQVPLPQLLPAGREPIDVYLPDGHRSVGSGRRYSNSGFNANSNAFNAADSSRKFRAYSTNSTGSNHCRGGGADGGRNLSRKRPLSSSSSSSSSPPPPPSRESRHRSRSGSDVVSGSSRGLKKGGAASATSPSPLISASPARRRRAAAATGREPSPAEDVRSSSPPRPPLSRGAALPRAVGASSGPGVGGGSGSASHRDGGRSEVAGNGGKQGAVRVDAEGGGGREDRRAGETPPVEESAALHRDPSDVPAAAAAAAATDGDDGDDASPSPPPAPAAVSLPRPTNPNDLVRLFLAESGGGGGGGAAAAALGGVPADGDASIEKDASAGAPAAAASGCDAVDDDGPLDGHEREGGVGQVAREEEEERQKWGGHGDNACWAAASPVDSEASGADSGFGRDTYNNHSGGDDADELEAGSGGIGEGNFYIDPRGDGSFTTTAARCFKAVIHRIPVAQQALPRVHGGFWEAYSALREKVLAALAVEMQDNYRPLYVTGHSLGGALASLAAYDIDKNFTLPDPMTLYTFGSPRVGNGVFARKLNSRVKHHFRVVNDGDLITALPPFFGSYKHAGCKVVVDSERYGNFIVAPTLVEQTFGAKPLRSISPHLLNQYRECLEACMEEADLEEYFSRGIGVDPTLIPEWLKGKRRKHKEDEPALL